MKSFTRDISIHNIFEIYPNIDPNTREVIYEDGTRGPKMPNGGVRLRFIGPVPKWYSKREEVYRKEFGQLSSTNNNPLEVHLQDKNDIFGGLYCYSDDFHTPSRGAGYIGIGTAGQMTEKKGTDPFGGGSLSRIWAHVLKLLGRHESCNVKLTGGWKAHKELRDSSLGDPLLCDVKFSFYMDYRSNKAELLKIESAMQELRVGKYGSKFPINCHPASSLEEFCRLPI